MTIEDVGSPLTIVCALLAISWNRAYIGGWLQTFESEDEIFPSIPIEHAETVASPDPSTVQIEREIYYKVVGKRFQLTAGGE